MTDKDKKHTRTMEIAGGVILILYALCQWVFFPYIAVIKAENGKFKEACAYVVGKEKTKYSYDYIIRVDDEYYIDREIIPVRGMSVLRTESWNNLPIQRKRRNFLSIEPNVCKKVQYVEVYNIFGFKKFYLYDYLNQH